MIKKPATWGSFWIIENDDAKIILRHLHYDDSFNIFVMEFINHLPQVFEVVLSVKRWGGCF
jgi:hypothetical protein